MALKLVEAGEIVLRQRARALSMDEIAHSSTRELIEAMYETMRAAPGVGLAAPQIGVGIQLAVVEDRPEYIAKMAPEQAAERRRDAVPAHVIINPSITIEDADHAEFFEGCLSLPGFTAIVPRALAVRVECLNERAEPITIHAGGWYARILQHEIDHLQGTLYIDRMLSRTFMGRQNYERFWSAVPVEESKRALCELSASASTAPVQMSGSS